MAVGDAHVFPGFLTPVLSRRLLFSHASAEVRGENTPERNFTSSWSRTHNHQVMSLTPGATSRMKMINFSPEYLSLELSKLNRLAHNPGF